MPHRQFVQRAQDSIKGLAADLNLLDQMRNVKRELALIEDRCMFLESIFGRRDPRYTEVHIKRDQLLLRADELVQQWMVQRECLPTAHA